MRCCNQKNFMIKKCFKRNGAVHELKKEVKIVVLRGPCNVIRNAGFYPFSNHEPYKITPTYNDVNYNSITYPVPICCISTTSYFFESDRVEAMKIKNSLLRPNEKVFSSTTLNLLTNQALTKKIVAIFL